MEIQDRNSLLQILTGARETGVQLSSVEGSAFAEVLKSAQTEMSSPEKNTDDITFKPVLKQNSTSDNLGSVEKKLFDDRGVDNNKKDPPKKAEAKNTETAQSKEKEEVSKDADEEKSVCANQSTEKVNEVDAKEQQNTESEVSQTSETQEGEDTLSLSQETVPADIIAQGVDEVVLQAFLQGNNPITTEEVPVFDELVTMQNVVENNVEEIVLQEVQKQEVATTSKAVSEELVPMSEEEALLMEQAKLLDEKITTDKKLKIEVNVSEEKIADPIVKDVLKNRFEIDSMFQSVDIDTNAEALVTDVEIVAEETPVTDSDVVTLPEIKTNAAYNEVKVVQDSAKTASLKDATVVSVSGKEVVAEVANVSRNEAFAKITEASSRDNFKGMAKEVVEQIKVNITKSAVKGIDTIDIQLKPEDLGKVQIKMHIAKDGKIQAEIIASRAETADLLQKDASSLSKAFNDAGYDTDAKSFSFRQENQANGQEKDNAELLKFIGDTLEQEAENIAGNDNSIYDPALGLNIRV